MTMESLERRRLLGGGAAAVLGTVLSACGGGGSPSPGVAAGGANDGDASAPPPVTTAPSDAATPTPPATDGRPRAADPAPERDWPDAVGRSRRRRIVGYSDQESYAPGETVSLHLSLENAPAPLDVTGRLWRHRDRAPAGHAVVRVHEQPVRELDQGWDVTYRFTAPLDEPGMYVVTFDGFDDAALYFVLREAPDRRNPLVLLVSTATAQAYCNYGGKSLYEDTSSERRPARRVSRRRPIHAQAGTWGSGMDWHYEGLGVAALVAWLHATGRPPAMVTDLDLHRDASVLAGRRCLVTAGHNEYWTREMRDAVDGFVAAGGHVMNLGGNTAVWQIRYEDNDATIVGYKHAAAADPTPDGRRRTTAWHWIGRSAGTTFGSTPEFGAYNDKGLPSLAYGAYRTDHWAYAGTGLRDGASFGGDLGIATYEVDGIDTVWRDGLPFARNGSGAPSNYRVLAWCAATGWWPLDCQSGTMAMGMHSVAGGGTVFSCGTVQWGLAFLQAAQTGSIDANPVVRITHNVLAHLLAPAIVGWTEAATGRVRLRPVATPAEDGWTAGPIVFHATAEPIDDAQVPLWRLRRRGSDGSAERLSRHADPGPDWIRHEILCWVYADGDDDRVAIHGFAGVDATGEAQERYAADPTPRAGEAALGVLWHALK